MNKGWITLHRKIQDCWIWEEDEPFDRRSAWIDLLLLANHEDAKVFFDGDLITVQRGQRITSIRKLAERWKWSRTKVTKFLDILEKDGMITRRSDTKKTLLTIENYGIYQDVASPEKPQKGHREAAEKPQKSTNNNDKTMSNNDKQYYKDSRLNDAFADFVKMRKSIKKPMSDRAITMAKNNLEKLSGNDIDKAIMILEQSIYHCWQGLFELKDASFLEQYRELKQAKTISVTPDPKQEMTFEEWEKMFGEENA